jgi:hypothetical protein
MIISTGILIICGGDADLAGAVNQNVHWMFTECSLNVHWMFTECSLNVHWVFTECSLNVHWMFPKCSPNVPWMLPGRRRKSESDQSRRSRQASRVHSRRDCSLIVHWVFTECSPNVPQMFPERSMNVAWPAPYRKVTKSPKSSSESSP